MSNYMEIHLKFTNLRSKFHLVAFLKSYMRYLILFENRKSAAIIQLKQIINFL